MSIKKLIAKPDQRLKELERLVERQAKQIERLRKPRITPIKGRRTVRGKTRIEIICGDSHGAYHDPAAVAAFLGDVKLLKPSKIVHVGDILDCAGFLSSHGVMGVVPELDYTFEQDVLHANDLLDGLAKAAPGAAITVIEGNHECLEEGTEVLTSGGWTPIEKFNPDRDKVACLSEEGVSRWCRATSTNYQYDGDMVVINARGGELPMTPGHRVAYWTQSGTELKYRLAETLTGGGTSLLPTAGQNANPEYPISDEELRLAAWLLTDGSTSRHYIIYQSKQKFVAQIRGLLESLNIPHRETVRNRKPPAEIAGVAVKTAMAAHEFHFKEEDLPVSLWMLKKGCLPVWAFSLSARQFAVFFRTILDADASQQSKSDSGALYGEEPWLSEVQRLAAVNRVRTSLRMRSTWRGDHWVLNYSFRDRIKAEHRRVTRRPYKGRVYCLTTPLDNFFVRYNGTVFVTGNCRIKRQLFKWVLGNKNDAEFLLRMFGPEAVLNTEKRGIRYIHRDQYYDGLSISGAIRLEPKAIAQHGEQFCGAQASSRLLKSLGVSVFSGHTHRLDVVYAETAESKVVSVKTGCLCQHRPLYGLTKPTDWMTGYVVRVVSGDGFLAFPVPIISGVSYLNCLAKVMKL